MLKLQVCTSVYIGKTSVVLGLLIGCPGVITIYLGKLEILVGKSNGLRHFVWEASEKMGCVLR